MDGFGPLALPSKYQKVRTKHQCVCCGEVFVIEHWADTKQSGRCYTTPDLSAWFGPYCRDLCYTKDVVARLRYEHTFKEKPFSENRKPEDLPGFLGIVRQKEQASK